MPHYDYPGISISFICYWPVIYSVRAECLLQGTVVYPGVGGGPVKTLNVTFSLLSEILCPCHLHNACLDLHQGGASAVLFRLI